MPLVESYSPRGLARLFLRSPVWLYRLRLGWLVGRRLLMLSHTGRMTGKTRNTVLEVVGHDKSSSTYTVASAWGENAHWFRNILQNPEVRIAVGRQRFDAVAERLVMERAEQVFLEYAEHNPTAFRFLQKLVTGNPFQDFESACRQMAELVPAVTFRPRVNVGSKVM